MIGAIFSNVLHSLSLKALTEKCEKSAFKNAFPQIQIFRTTVRSKPFSYQISKCLWDHVP